MFGLTVTDIAIIAGAIAFAVLLHFGWAPVLTH
jgi:hypothetical protein